MVVQCWLAYLCPKIVVTTGIKFSSSKSTQLQMDLGMEGGIVFGIDSKYLPCLSAEILQMMQTFPARTQIFLCFPVKSRNGR